MLERRGKPVAVGLWGHNGTGNLGNEATISAILQNLRKRVPDISLYGFSWDPEDTRLRHGIVSYPVRRRSVESNKNDNSEVYVKPRYEDWKSQLKRYPLVFKVAKWLLTPLMEFIFAVQACRSLSNIDLMLVVGTGLLADTFGGYRNYPSSLFRWSIFCRLRKVKWGTVSVGAGPIGGTISKYLIKCSLSRAAYLSFRDEHSRKLIEELGVKRDNHVYPDLVFGLELPEFKLPSSNGDRRIVAINALPYRKPGAWENSDNSIYDHYRKVLIEFISWLVQEGYEVMLVPTQLPMDADFLQDLKDEIETNYPKKLSLCSTANVAGGVEDIITQFSKASMVVTTRFHGVIFPFLLGKPVLALSYHPKMTELMKDFGQNRFCMDIEKIDLELLVNIFRELESEKDVVSMQIKKKVDFNKELLDDQYKKIMNLLSA